ncbi:MAG TPA: adenylate/guanylate cyclase domain-containing protein [Bacteroidia bacterium]|nr:adenylate/guanylate cyclase domain-containing protein [Bacteroidia bacterium]
MPIKLWGQEDSLLKVLQQAGTDSTKVAVLIELSTLMQDTDLKKAESYAKQSIEISESAKYLKGIAESYRYVGLAQFYQGLYGEAVNSWQKSLAMYDSIGDRTNVARMYSNIGAVYESQSDDPKALEYNLKSQKVAEEINDTTRLMSALTNIGVIYGKKRQTYDKGIEYSTRALDFAKKVGNNEMESKISTNLGEIYFELGRDTLALQFFENAVTGYKGSEALSPALLNIGKVYAQRNDFLLAENYQKQALAIAEKLDSKRDMATALLNLASAYDKKGESDKALESYEKAKDISLSIDVPEELKRAYTGLAKIYSDRKDFKQAYKYQSLLNDVKDTLYNIEYQQKMSGQLFAYEIEKKQNQITILNKDKELQEIDLQKQKFAKNAFMAGLILIFIIAFIIFRNYQAKVKTNKILDRQKVEIENLLLNILPQEVANELQKNGQATPRSYESVSVLFTDFKGFTTIAEGMAPHELVAELNTFFVAFDDIIEKNNLEKIKTIGDAYMCAGGIPTTNNTHPIDIINAGLQIQQFMADHNSKRKEKGLPVWGLRVGVHTGPITAGVVGRKKYAYDIWGNTVNVASRMESNGEVGKVNISSATFELIKNNFNCTHRGKISAKNIGEIDMYFVNN